MHPVIKHVGRAVVLRRSDVDTDQIIPAEYCKRLTKSGYEDALFAHWRTEPGFILNDAASVGASILVAGYNFGTGSSREHAVWALSDWGFGAVVAPSFGDIFLRNAWKNGLMAVALPADAVDWLADQVAANPQMPVVIDLEECQLAAAGRRYDFDVDKRAQRLLLNGRDDISETLQAEAAIAAHESGRPAWLPRLDRGSVSMSGSLSGRVPVSAGMLS